MLVVGIDPGLTATGMVLYDADADVILANETWRGKRRRGALTDSEWLQQAIELSRSVTHFVMSAEFYLAARRDDGNVLAVETAAGVRASSRGRSHAAMMSVYGALGAVAASAGSPLWCTRIIGAHVLDVREAITGIRHASKRDVRRYLELRYIKGAEKLQSDHEWDALAVAVYAASLVNVERRSEQ